MTSMLRRLTRRALTVAVLLVAVAGVGVANAAPADAPMVGTSDQLLVGTAGPSAE
jgi:hypothetical protein